MAAAGGSTRVTIPAAWTLRALYFAIGLWTAAIGPFISVILRGRGFDPAAIGLVSACAALAVIVVVPVWGHVADVLVGRARAFRIGLILAAGAAVALLLPLPAIAVTASLASFSLFTGMFNSLSDALAIDALSAPERQYGALRAQASLSFTIGVIAVGFFYDWAGYGAASVVSLVWSAALFLLIGRVAGRTHDPVFRLLASSHGGERAAGRFGSVSRAFAGRRSGPGRGRARPSRERGASRTLGPLGGSCVGRSCVGGPAPVRRTRCRDSDRASRSQSRNPRSQRRPAH